MVSPESLTQETHFLVCCGASHEEFQWSAQTFLATQLGTSFLERAFYRDAICHPYLVHRQKCDSNSI